MIRVLSLFAGIGGSDIGLARTGGFETVAFCEIEPFPRRILAKHWPHVPCYDDVRTLTAERLAADGIAVDAICGGFPCQDISLAGRGAGIEGPKSGLWSEYARLVGEIRPLFVIVENSPGLRTRGADRVLSDLEALGYAGEPFVVGSIHAGAPQERKRAWIVAHTLRQQHQGGSSADGREAAEEFSSGTDRQGLEIVLDGKAAEQPTSLRAHEWTAEPDVVRVVYGVPARAHRIKALGNSNPPAVYEMIGRAILASMQQAA